MLASRRLLDLPEFQSWSSQLKAIAQRPLQAFPQFPVVARRFEAWWNQQIMDRPIFFASANGEPSSPITRRLDLLESPQEWLRAKLEDLRQTVWFGDAVPHIRVDFGAACLGGLIGAPVEHSSDTTWTHACILAEDWSDAPAFQLQGNWWRRLQVLLDLAAEAAREQFLVCTPSLGGLSDVLTNLRSATEMCVDVALQPERIIAALNHLFPAWQRSFAELYHRIVGAGAGLVHWHLLWSDVPYVVTECDLSFSISQSDFARICLPDIARCAASVGRSVFHLDGAGSTRHIDALLEVPEIQAIQYTPGAGSPSALAWSGMFKKIQAKGRSVLIFAPPEEVLPLFEDLPPEGLAVFVDGGANPSMLKAIQDRFEARFGAGAECQ